MASLLFNVNATDSTTFVFVSRHTGRSGDGRLFLADSSSDENDPMVALRYE
jgi:hypothetical protein